MRPRSQNLGHMRQGDTADGDHRPGRGGTDGSQAIQAQVGQASGLARSAKDRPHADVVDGCAYQRVQLSTRVYRRADDRLRAEQLRGCTRVAVTLSQMYACPPQIKSEIDAIVDDQALAALVGDCSKGFQFREMDGVGISLLAVLHGAGSRCPRQLGELQMAVTTLCGRIGDHM